MMDFLQITNDPELARHCDLLPGMRLFVDLEIHGKAQRQAGHNTFISSHRPEDVGRIKARLQCTRLMVRVNPLHDGSAAELDSVLAQGADSVMLPMFHGSDELRRFSALLAGRAPLVALLETAGALHGLEDWLDTPGLCEVFVGLNDLHLALGCRFMFEPLAQGLIDKVAARVQAHGLRFGFGGIARLDEGLLPGRSVLAEHVRLGSGAVILSRSFQRDATLADWQAQVLALRQSERDLATRSAARAESDRLRIWSTIESIATGMAPGMGPAA